MFVSSGPRVGRELLALTLLLSAPSACAGKETETLETEAGATDRWCDLLPREANTAFERVDMESDWFEVYEVEDGVFALTEPNQFQETISYLILGTERAVLFDTGLGMTSIRAVVDHLTRLPVVVLNSHTHYDHVGGNHEFDTVLTVDTPYSRSNQRGQPHSEVAGEVAEESFCEGPPKGLDTELFHTRPWTTSGTVVDGDSLDLGGRLLEVLHIPGHTPDSLALLDRQGGLLWTGDSYYDATIWLYVPETDLDAYEHSIARLSALVPSVRRLLPAHNTISADPAHLSEAARAIRQIRNGSVQGVERSGKRVVFRFENFSILTSRPLLDGKRGIQSDGGSGLSTWR